ADVERPSRGEMGGVHDGPIDRLGRLARRFSAARDVQSSRPVTSFAGDAWPDRSPEPFGNPRGPVRDPAVAGDTRRGDPAIESLVLPLMAGVEPPGAFGGEVADRHLEKVTILLGHEGKRLPAGTDQVSGETAQFVVRAGGWWDQGFRLAQPSAPVLNPI